MLLSALNERAEMLSIFTTDSRAARSFIFLQMKQMIKIVSPYFVTEMKISLIYGGVYKPVV